LDTRGDAIEYPSVCPGAGTHTIGIRAACTSLKNPQEIDIQVNGKTVADNHTLACWTDKLWFMDYRVKAAFTSGNNTVRIIKQDKGNLSMDRIVIYRCDPDIVPTAARGG